MATKNVYLNHLFAYRLLVSFCLIQIGKSSNFSVSNCTASDILDCFASIEQGSESFLEINWFTEGRYLPQVMLRMVANLSSKPEQNETIAFEFKNRANYNVGDRSRYHTYDLVPNTNLTTEYGCVYDQDRDWVPTVKMLEFRSLYSWSKQMPLVSQSICFHNRTTNILYALIWMDPFWPVYMNVEHFDKENSTVWFYEKRKIHKQNNELKTWEKSTDVVIPLGLDIIQRMCASSFQKNCLFQTLTKGNQLQSSDQVNCVSSDSVLKNPNHCMMALAIHESLGSIYIVGYMHSTLLEDSFQLEFELLEANQTQQKIFQFFCKRHQQPNESFIIVTETENIHTPIVVMNKNQFSDPLWLVCAWQTENILFTQPIPNIYLLPNVYSLTDQIMNLKVSTFRSGKMCKFCQFILKTFDFRKCFSLPNI